MLMLNDDAAGTNVNPPSVPSRPCAGTCQGRTIQRPIAPPLHRHTGRKRSGDPVPVSHGLSCFRIEPAITPALRSRLKAGMTMEMECVPAVNRSATSHLVIPAQAGIQ